MCWDTKTQTHGVNAVMKYEFCGNCEGGMYGASAIVKTFKCDQTTTWLTSCVHTSIHVLCSVSALTDKTTCALDHSAYLVFLLKMTKVYLDNCLHLSHLINSSVSNTYIPVLKSCPTTQIMWDKICLLQATVLLPPFISTANTKQTSLISLKIWLLV